MHYSRPISFLLTGVLLFQLTSIHIQIPVFEYSFGVTSEFVKQQKTPSFSFVPVAVQSVSEQQPYDSVLFVGDVLLARNTEHLMRIHGNDYPYRSLSFSEVANRPAVVGNFEASMPKIHKQTPTHMLTFSVASTFIPPLALAGFTHMSLANNHTFDYSQSGYNNTQTTLDQNGIVSFGHPNMLNKSSIEYVEIDKKVVAIIAVHTLQRLPTYSELKEVFSYATARSDLQVAYVHWGTEYAASHNTRQREAAERFVDAGADLVIGHHPHVVQDIELVHGVPVFYSLGNYIFDQYDSVATQEGLMLHLEFSQEQPRVSLLPVTSVGTLSQPRYMQTQNHATFLADLADRSDPKLTDFIKNGQIIIGDEVASSSKVAIMSL
jgi:poly-gamma-glutamate synthesis protein (capsule biosynthesis protein)